MCLFSGKGSSRSNVSSSEALDMHVRRPASATSPSSTEVASNGGSKKKSILKKSESGSHHGHHLRNSKQVADPELENLLVSDQETSANNTPALVRKPPLSIVNLPPTANNDQLKSLTGPKLRMGAKYSTETTTQPQPHYQQQHLSQQPRKPILVNNVNNNKNNGNVASKEIQTSTANLLALAATAASAASTNNNINATSTTSNNTSDNVNPANAKKFERGREPAPNLNTSTSNTEAATTTTDLTSQLDGLNPVFKCPNDMCRHNKPSSTLTTSKRKICLCGRTMVNQNNLLRNQSASGTGSTGGEAAVSTEAPPDLLTSSTQERISS